MYWLTAHSCSSTRLIDNLLARALVRPISLIAIALVMAPFESMKSPQTLASENYTDDEISGFFRALERPLRTFREASSVQSADGRSCLDLLALFQPPYPIRMKSKETRDLRYSIKSSVSARWKRMTLFLTKYLPVLSLSLSFRMVAVMRVSASGMAIPVEARGVEQTCYVRVHRIQV